MTNRSCYLVFFLILAPAIAAQTELRPFTVADDIKMVHFGDPYLNQIAPISVSPNGAYVVVNAERGLLKRNRPESILRVYSTADIHRIFLQPRRSLPVAVWIIKRSTYSDGPIITRLKWLPDSQGFAFLQKTSSGKDQLALAELPNKKLELLTPANQQVTAFDIRDRQHFVYTVLNPDAWKPDSVDGGLAMIDGTGHSLYELAFPHDFILLTHVYDICELWGFINGKRFRISDADTGLPYPIHDAGQRSLALAPNGLSVVTALSVQVVPPEWAARYPSFMKSEAYRIRPGNQNPEAPDGRTQVSRYVRIDLNRGTSQPVVNAPIANISAGWLSSPSADWSTDGKWLVVAGTFLPAGRPSVKARTESPCVALLKLSDSTISCIEKLGVSKDGASGITSVKHVRFSPGSHTRIFLDYLLRGSEHTGLWMQNANGLWTMREPVAQQITTTIQQDSNHPPVLTASDNIVHSARVLWNPNVFLKDVRLGEAAVFNWKDDNSRTWSGLLFEPPDLKQGTRYPLVIQTHGFSNGSFEPSGIYPTAFAAREMAARGIVVLQVQDCPPTINSEEGQCQVRGYESAVRQLVSEGKVNPDRVGIVGFSRSCYYVLQALTTSSLHFRAASITSGIDVGYVQYIANVDTLGNALAREANAIIGKPPFGDGLQQWFKFSPEFNLDKIRTPIQIVAAGSPNLVFDMIEPYAALRYLDKPVDLVVLRGGTHVLTNPAERMASQGGTVDWFRFWLKDEEDSSPAKRKQYWRWRQLRDMENSQAAVPGTLPGAAPKNSP